MLNRKLMKKAWLYLIVINCILVFIDMFFRYENGRLQYGHGISENLFILVSIFSGIAFLRFLFLSIEDIESIPKLVFLFIANISLGFLFYFVLWIAYVLFSGVVVF